MIPIVSGRAVAVVVGSVLGLAACGGASRAGSAPAEPTAPTPDPVPRVALDSVVAEEPSAAFLPMGVSWSPPTPTEGEALALWLHRADGSAAPREVKGRLGGRPVHLSPVGDAWFGLAAAPIGSAGKAELVLRFRLGADSTVVQRTTLTVAERTFPSTELSVAPRYSRFTREALVRIREERELITATLAQVTPRWRPEGPFVRPRGTRVTSPFGQRRVFNDELKSRHTGVDMEGSEGAPVKAAGRGRVALTGDFYFSGNAVFLDHGLGVFTGYFHLSRILVEEGQQVERGEVLGEVGATGRVTGPHLHWSLYVNGESLDARSLLGLRLPGVRTARAGDGG